MNNEDMTLLENLATALETAASELSEIRENDQYGFIAANVCFAECARLIRERVESQQKQIEELSASRCDGCPWPETSGCHCARAPWRKEKEDKHAADQR